MSVTDLTEQLTSTEQLVTQLKELIREKDAELRNKDLQLKVPCVYSCQKDCLKNPFSPVYHELFFVDTGLYSVTATLRTQEALVTISCYSCWTLALLSSVLSVPKFYLGLGITQATCSLDEQVHLIIARDRLTF